MNRLVDRVEQLLRYGYKTATPQTLRDNDKALILAILDQDGLHLTDEQKRAYMASTTFESITRARRALKAQYPASEAVDQARFDKYQQYRFEGVAVI
jgi:lambda repressor-like predicted transcriptional regulator